MGRQQLTPLSTRMNAAQLERRAARMIARRQVADTLHRQLGQVVGFTQHVTEPLNRGLLGRLKWLMLGK